MKAFMDKEFMLQSPTAQHLYHAYAADMPICDYHCHIPPREIYENRRFDNIAQVWLGGRNPDGSYFGDHYKWRVMRSNGVPEEYITGDKPDRERFQKFAEALPMAIGNPMYHWTNLELHTFFGYDGVLNGDTAEEVWNLCNDKLQHDPKLTVRGLIEQSNVAFIGTTDDPIDSLEWHKKIKEDPTIKFTVAPSFRPDKALNINKPGFAEYMGKLAAAVGKGKLACINRHAVGDLVNPAGKIFLAPGHHGQVAFRLHIAFAGHRLQIRMALISGSRHPGAGPVKQRLNELAVIGDHLARRRAHGLFHRLKIRHKGLASPHGLHLLLLQIFHMKLRFLHLVLTVHLLVNKRPGDHSLRPQRFLPILRRNLLCHDSGQILFHVHIGFPVFPVQNHLFSAGNERYLLLFLDSACPCQGYYIWKQQCHDAYHYNFFCH